MDIWSHLELNYKTGLLHLHQIAGAAGFILTTSDFREPAVYLFTSIRGTSVSCLLIIKYRSIWPYMKQFLNLWVDFLLKYTMFDHMNMFDSIQISILKYRCNSLSWPPGQLDPPGVKIPRGILTPALGFLTPRQQNIPYLVSCLQIT